MPIDFLAMAVAQARALGEHLHPEFTFVRPRHDAHVDAYEAWCEAESVRISSESWAAARALTIRGEGKVNQRGRCRVCDL